MIPVIQHGRTWVFFNTCCPAARKKTVKFWIFIPDLCGKNPDSYLNIGEKQIFSRKLFDPELRFWQRIFFPDFNSRKISGFIVYTWHCCLGDDVSPMKWSQKLGLAIFYCRDKKKKKIRKFPKKTRQILDFYPGFMRKKSGFIPEYWGKADIFKEIGGKIISSKCLIRNCGFGTGFFSRILILGNYPDS
jgi:hypothetical protein